MFLHPHISILICSCYCSSSINKSCMLSHYRLFSIYLKFSIYGYDSSSYRLINPNSKILPNSLLDKSINFYEIKKTVQQTNSLLMLLVLFMVLIEVYFSP